MDKTPIEIAKDLDNWGFNVLPAKFKHKPPSVGWKQYQTKRTTQLLDSWFPDGQSSNYWILTGAISQLVVLDCDSKKADDYWRQILGDQILDETCQVKSAKGKHYYFRLEPGQHYKSWSVHEDGIDFDVRGDGGGVIAPPSTHESGHVYVWLRDPSHIQSLPSALHPDQTPKNETEGTGRSLLTYLLEHPPATGGRNNWLSKVCGHYAVLFRNMKDAYEMHVFQANDLLQPPLHKHEVEKTLNSIWANEQEKLFLGARDSDDSALNTKPDLDNGYLIKSGNQILCVTKYKTNDGWVTDLAQWADFSLDVKGVVEGETLERMYNVRINRLRTNDYKDALLPSSILNRPDKIHGWFNQFGVGILPPDNMWPRTGSLGERLRRHIESQDPPHFKVVDSLGWHEGGFVCHEGIITKDGLSDFTVLKPNPKLANWASYYYGFDDEAEAREVLREVLTFHDETICSVYGSWWAASFFKPQIHQICSQFPFMALEAPSESGKTTGFFGLMTQLNGNRMGQVDPTKASLRDAISAHQSGIVWIDDLNDPIFLFDLLRQATSEGSVQKKAEDHSSQATVKLVSPITISGESLRLGTQKALLDRAIQLKVPSPTSRMSKRNSEIKQWSDIQDLKQRHPNLTKFAGNIVQMALRQENCLVGLNKTITRSGRRQDKLNILRVGSEILANMTGDRFHIDRVATWSDNEDQNGIDTRENTLTISLIPQALIQLNWPDKPLSAIGREPATPVFVAHDRVWVSATNLANWWAEMNRGRVEIRTESAQALTQQLDALGDLVEAKQRFDLSSNRNKKCVYRGLSKEFSQILIERSQGI